jgi:tetratricopeptide (TPR) repeat protein
MRNRLIGLLVAGMVLTCLAGILIYNLPPVHARLAWRVENLRVQIRRAINPPEEAVFVPRQQLEAAVQATLLAMTVTAALPTATLTATPTPATTATPLPSPTPTPIPAQAALSGIRHEYQQFNNCGPANLAMGLSYWDWQGDQRDTAAFLRPGEYDKNVMPAEMVAFVEEKTELKALSRVGGDLNTIKRFIAAGFPVLIEKGYDPEHDDWMGHYLTLNAYDDTQSLFTAQDSLIMPDFPLPYQTVEERWRDFNFVYVIIYPPEREAEVMAILGPQADETQNYQAAAELAAQETAELSGRDLYFAWFNLGSNLVALGDHARAAQAFDSAFAVYPSIPETERPWRAMWYRVEPYAAYYHTGRYQDVINLANNTFFALGEYTLEESFYWRGLANQALGDSNGAIFDLRKVLELNPNFTLAQDALLGLGIEVP